MSNKYLVTRKNSEYQIYQGDIKYKPMNAAVIILFLYKKMTEKKKKSWALQGFPDKNFPVWELPIIPQAFF